MLLGSCWSLDPSLLLGPDLFIFCHLVGMLLSALCASIGTSLVDLHIA